MKGLIFKIFDYFSEISLKREEVEAEIKKLNKRIDDLTFKINLDTNKDTIKVKKEIWKQLRKEIIDFHKSLFGKHNHWMVVEPVSDSD